MDQEANNRTAWHEAFPQASMIDQQLPLPHDGNWNAWAKAPSEVGNYRLTPQREVPPDTLHKAWNFRGGSTC
jgi:hypothetical protein